MEQLYSNYISLGYFCEVAQDLEKLGLRSSSSPFDWGISCLPNVIDAIDNEFDGFLDYENLSQCVTFRSRYHEDKYHFFFFHDFSQYKSLDKQYEIVKDKYWRRILRFLHDINEPTLFVRYISAEELDEDGCSVEMKWIEQNYQYILDVLKRYNINNDIIFIGDESIKSDIVKVYKVPCDEGDCVSRLPIYNNKELYPILSSVLFPGKEENKRRYETKARKKRSIITRLKKKLFIILQRVFLNEYNHCKVYYDSGK